ncbi:hypothetical protein EMIT0P218_30497 [Pseudomonas sp. IT-P218]
MILKTVGARLAGEGVLEYCSGLSGLFAGKPAPTKVRGALRCGRRGFVGARLAGEGVFEYCVEFAGLFAGKPAPTKVCAGRCVAVDADL